MMPIAFCAISSLEEETKIVPSSSTSMPHLVSSIMERTTRPPGPMTVPIFSTGICTRYILGAYLESSARGSGMVSSIFSRMVRRASFAWWSAFSITSTVIPFTLMSIWRAVIPSSVPATLKSMSPSESSRPAMSVKTAYLPSSASIKPMAIPATGAVSGTPASISESVLPQTLAMEVLPLLDSTSDTRRIV